MLNVQMYHTKKLPRDLMIHGDPYEHANVCEHLKEMGVIFYRDENHAHNALGKQKYEVASDIYYSQTIFNEITWSVDKWNSKVMKKSDKVFEDSYVWLVHNKDKKLKYMSTKEVITIDK